LVRHEHLSQRDEELMHFMEGKFQIDFCVALRRRSRLKKRWAIYCTRSAVSDEGADRLRDLQFLRALPRGVPGIGNPPDLAGATALVRGAGG
jgi:hypothetical protein